jgi:metal-responsive CopG/Arc/MetJ family transcriptional regulator
LPKNTKILSLSLEPEYHDQIDKAVEKKDTNRSVLFREILNNVPVDEDLTELLMLSLDEDLIERFTQAAEKRGKTVSDLFRDILNKFPLDKDDDLYLVALQIPKNLDNDELKRFLQTRFSTLLSKLGS